WRCIRTAASGRRPAGRRPCAATPRPARPRRPVRRRRRRSAPGRAARGESAAPAGPIRSWSHRTIAIHRNSKIQCIDMRRRIAVVGAGPAGLAFARVMHRRGHPVTVLERDPSPDARPQGGVLDLHEELGQLALDKAGLLEGFRALSRSDGQAMRILDTDGTVLRDWRPCPGDLANPEIDRWHLRDLLLGPLDVQWGRGVARVVPGTPDGTLVHFADGRREAFDLVVGADGAWSRVRPAVSPAAPHHTGVTLVETSLDDVDARHPDLARLIGDGALAVYGVNRALVAQRGSGGHVKVYAQFRAAPERHADPGPAGAEAVR